MKDRIIKGDSLEVLSSLPDESVNLVVTSPPYNKSGFRGRRDSSKGVGRWSGSDIKYGDFGDDLPEDVYREQQTLLLNELFRVLKPDGSIFYNHKVRRANNEASHPLEWVLKSRVKFYQQIVWDRGSGPDHNVNYLDPTTELIFWLTKKSPKVFKRQNQYVSEIWRINPDFNNEHPAPFPEELVTQCVDLTTEEGDTVLDPYMGSGTVAVVSKRMGRNYIGIELNQEYIDLAQSRILTMTKSLF